MYQNVWSPRYIDALILRDACDPATGAMLPAERLFYLADANYNVTGVVRENPASPGEWHVVERYVYDPYGRATVCDGDWTIRPDGPDANTTPGDESAFGNAVLYCGYHLDRETGLYIVRHRYYHNTVSTWTARDPMGYAAGDTNLYRYCANNVTHLVDPSGLGGMLEPRIDWTGGWEPKPQNRQVLERLRDLDSRRIGAPTDPRYIPGFKLCHRKMQKGNDCCENAAIGLINCWWCQISNATRTRAARLENRLPPQAVKLGNIEKTGAPRSHTVSGVVTAGKIEACDRCD